MEISERKLAANRRNALSSTGPRTRRGKAREARNAVFHGMFSRTLVLHRESSLRFRKLRDSIVSRFDPADAFEETLVARIVADSWKLQRLHRAEWIVYGTREQEVRFDHADAVDAKAEENRKYDYPGGAAHRPRTSRREAEGLLPLPSTLSGDEVMAVLFEDEKQVLDRYQKYEMRLEMSILRCERALRKCRKDRSSEDVDTTGVPDFHATGDDSTQAVKGSPVLPFEENTTGGTSASAVEPSRVPPRRTDESDRGVGNPPTLQLANQNRPSQEDAGETPTSPTSDAASPDVSPEIDAISNIKNKPTGFPPPTPSPAETSNRLNTYHRIDSFDVETSNPTFDSRRAGVAELADAQDLGSCTERCRGSTPLSCIASANKTG